MKAIRLHELEGPDELVYEDVPEPEPGPGETVVRLRAAALNRRDLFATQGQYPGVTPDILPKIPGSDGSGEVVARGEGAEGPDEGTEVVINPALYWGDDPRVPGKEYRILGCPTTGRSPSSSRCLRITSSPSPRTSRTRRPPRCRSPR